MIAEQGQQALERNCASTFFRETLGWSQEREALSRQIASAHPNKQTRHKDPNSSSVALCWSAAATRLSISRGFPAAQSLSLRSSPP